MGFALVSAVATPELVGVLAWWAAMLAVPVDPDAARPYSHRRQRPLIDPVANRLRVQLQHLRDLRDRQERFLQLLSIEIDLAEPG